MRLFIAADIPGEIRERISSLMQPWRRERGVRWVPPENLHITLYFLGSLEEGGIEEIERAGLNAVNGKEAFTVQVEGVSAFPSVSRPRVFWVGVSDEGRLKSIYEDLGRELAACSLEVPLEKSGYVPHITLGRVKQRCSASLMEQVRTAAAARFGGCTVDHLTLYQSVLSPRGASYRQVLRWPL
jgi:2'-5' RNA ligase